MIRRTWFDHIIGLVAVFGGIAICAALIFVEIPPANENALIFAAGILLGWGSTVINNRYGSSKGSEDKTHILGERPTGEPDDPVSVTENE